YGDWVSPGAHINAVGACRPDWRELDDALLMRARVWVDSRDAAFQESGDVIAAGQGRVVGEGGSVGAGNVGARTQPDEITLFKALGVGVEDVAAAELVLARLVAGS